MSFYQRAIRYTSRQKGKSVLLGAIFLISLAIGTFGISTLRVADQAIEEIGASTDVSVNIFSGDFVSNELAEGLIDQIDSLDNIGAINRSNHIHASQHQEERIFSLYGFDDFTLDGPFLWQIIEMVEGNYLLNENEVVVNNEFAEALEWQLGDIIVLESKSGSLIEVTIAGIYQAVDQSQEFDLTIMYVSPDLINLVQEEGLYLGLQVMIENPRYLDATYEQIGEILAGSFANMSVLDALYQQLKAPMEGLQQLLEVILVVTLFVAIVVISLLLVLWVKERRRETGILLSVGVAKKEIFMQRFIEIFIIFLITFVFISLINNFALPTIGASLFVDFNELGNSAELGQVTLSLGFSDLVITLGLGLLIISISVLIASTSLFKTQPKEMLASID